MLDWVISIKSNDPEWVDSTADDFHDLMADKFETMSDVGKEAGRMGLTAIKGAYMQKASAKSIDLQIEKGIDVDDNLELMKKIYGEEKLQKMSPGEFYTTYQTFA